ncbi:hypothetical protein RJ639_008782 [Escallonia herrerae]|uniref:DNA2/NAM7 helicase helicase domain-containing protein n=1 Tax=Escallonia herrerae TaxID=1293975 RepID=A0AA89AW63_9ASTE|nr:hypothetical protein RJ639_008782 [Escallonia herrerae]
METISNAPFAEVVALKQSKRHGTLFYDVSVDNWRNTSRRHGKEPYRSMPGDIYVITEARPETISDLLRVGRTWSFGYNTRISGDDEGSTAATLLTAVVSQLAKHSATTSLSWNLFGDPGTGKTRTSRTVTCAPTNIAVTEVASRVLQLVKDSYKTGGLSDAPFCCLGGILLFRNVDRTASDIDEIYLDYRVEKLVECFGSPIGAVSKKQRASEAVVVRGEFKSLALFFRKCVSTLRTHLLMSFILEHNLKTMVSLVALLNAFETLLFRDNLVSFHVNMDSEMILYSGTECLSVLKTLRHSLEKLNLPTAANKESMEKLCFQMASSIFCTASSSYRLHMVPMDSIRLLLHNYKSVNYLIIPLQIIAIKHTILIGDECQLSATISSKLLFSHNFSKSFSKLRSSETKHLVLLLLSKLSNGWRPNRSSCESAFDILKQFKNLEVPMSCQPLLRLFGRKALAAVNLVKQMLKLLTVSILLRSQRSVIVYY